MGKRTHADLDSEGVPKISNDGSPLTISEREAEYLRRRIRQEQRNAERPRIRLPWRRGR